MADFAVNMLPDFNYEMFTALGTNTVNMVSEMSAPLKVVGVLYPSSRND